ncbi:MAG: hypothetical protein II921_07145 [Treponema sp.]|nr:hypothetical protein [Treponema sp.]
MKKWFTVLLLGAVFLFGSMAAGKKVLVPVGEKAAREACENFLNDYTFAKYLKATIVDEGETMTVYVRAAQIHGFSVTDSMLNFVFSREVVDSMKELSSIPLSACTEFEYRTGVLVLTVDAKKL